MKAHVTPFLAVIKYLLFIKFYFYSVTVIAELPRNAGKSKITKYRKNKSRKVTRQFAPRAEVFDLRRFTCSNPPSPAQPNGGLILVCSANEQVSLTSTPSLPTNGTDPCYFHCGLLWSGPNGWTFVLDPGPNELTGNPLYGTFGVTTPMALRAPGSVSPGNAGTVTLLAEYSNCTAPYNTSSSATVWVGGPGVSNGLVNGSPSSVPTYVPSGYANLSVSIIAGGSTNWYITHGSGSISPSNANCSASWSGFLRVVVETSNRCGSGGSWTFYLTTQQGYMGYRVAPNPAKDKISLLLDYKEMIGEVIQSVTLYDSDNKAWYSSDTNELKNTVGDKNAIDIPTKGFPRGTYFLHVGYGKDKVIKSQVILE